MSKDLSQYLHYYLGCECLVTVRGDFSENWKPEQLTPNHLLPVEKSGLEAIKPILRKLESMAEEEAHEICKLAIDPKYHDKIQIFEIKNQQIHFMDGTKWQGHGVEEFNDCYVHLKYLSATQFHYLLSRGFWLFGNDWFDEGYIIDKATVK